MRLYKICQLRIKENKTFCSSKGKRLNPLLLQTRSELSSELESSLIINYIEIEVIIY